MSSKLLQCVSKNAEICLIALMMSLSIVKVGPISHQEPLFCENA